MSGFAGVLYDRPVPDLRPTLSSMARAIAHRGPRTESLVLDGRCGFVTRQHERSAYQTAVHRHRSRVVVFDGALSDLATLARRFGASPAASPAEVLSLGYDRHGADVFDLASGAYAVVILDHATGAVALARDPFAHRPLYFGFDGHGFWCASEIKAILADPRFPRVVDSRQIAAALSFGVTVGPETLVYSLRKVIPGTCAVGTAGQPLAAKLHFRPDRIPLATLPRSTEAYGEAIWQELGENVRRQLRGSTRNGLFLSGGIDSALVGLSLSQNSAGRGHAMTCSYRERTEHDESDVAAQSASRCGLAFHKVPTGCEDDLVGALTRAIRQLEEPTRFSIAIPMQRALAEVGPAIQCLLTGDYADMFFGYDDHPFARMHGRIRAMPGILRSALRLARPLLARLPGTAAFARRFRAADVKDLREYTLDEWRVNPDGLGVFAPPDGAHVAGHVEELFPLVRGFPADVQWTLVAITTMVYCWNELFETLGSAAGLDVVNPFQSRGMLGIAMAMPYEFKFAAEKTKPCLRELAGRLFSHEFAHREKRIFASPLHAWMDGSKALHGAILDLGSGRSRLRDHLDAAAIRSLVARYERDRLTGPEGWKVANVLFLLLGLEIWLAQLMPAGAGPRLPGMERPLPEPFGQVEV